MVCSCVSGTQGEYFDKPIRCTENTKHAMSTQSEECEIVQKVQNERSDRPATVGNASRVTSLPLGSSTSFLLIKQVTCNFFE